jgi:hypothetical protein
MHHTESNLRYQVTLWLCLALVIGVLWLPSRAQAESYITTVVDYLEPERSSDPWIFLLSADGRALRVPQNEQARVNFLKSVAKRPKFISIEITNLGAIDRIDSLTEMTGLQSIDPAYGFPIEPMLAANDASLGRVDFSFRGYDLTPQGIFDFFRSMNLRTSSQCFHRAYYWSHQLWRQTGTLSHKVFMFFSWKYIRHYNYHWWFHVAPFVYDDQGNEVVLDPSYLRGPVSMKGWTDNFLRNDPHCPVVMDYEGHSAHGQNDWCYLVKKPMWYYHPNFVEQSNKDRKPVTKWDRDLLAISRTAR